MCLECSQPHSNQRNRIQSRAAGGSTGRGQNRRQNSIDDRIDRGQHTHTEGRTGGSTGDETRRALLPAPCSAAGAGLGGRAGSPPSRRRCRRREPGRASPPPLCRRGREGDGELLSVSDTSPPAPQSRAGPSVAASAAAAGWAERRRDISPRASSLTASAAAGYIRVRPQPRRAWVVGSPRPRGRVRGGWRPNQATPQQADQDRGLFLETGDAAGHY